MNDYSRTQATEYMNSIVCYLDLRSKGERNPESKCMPGSTVDDFVLGKFRDVKAKSPGLAVNTLALCEIVYGIKSGQQPGPNPSQPPRPRASAAALSPAPPQAAPARAGPVVGFWTGSDDEDIAASEQQQSSGGNVVDDDLKELLALEGADERNDSDDM
eukprot:6184072-Pleurochrysis_carterae.AAC.2